MSKSNVVTELKPQTGEVINFKRTKSNTLKKDGTPKNPVSGARLGDPHEVYPIKSKEEINLMIQYFLDKKNIAESDFDKKIAARNLMMFVVGINVALRAGDLLKLTWDDVFDEDGEFNDFTRMKEGKTHKFKNLFFNDGAKNAISKYVEEFNPDIHSKSFLFKSREKGSLTVRMAGKILSEAAIAVGLKYNVGSHTLRKTFGYWFIQNNKNDMAALAKLQSLLNHSSQATTLKYIGLSDEETRAYYDSNVLGIY